ncbi:hypothetical protein B0H66DRAFT_622909 [Apodospora peruviana]|uniref:UDP-glucoronosyl and UDP-glucosyl transferase family protein n=1 Tax=Apodospora peruviana TaxID=516989 RepID=A0AAE0I6Y4_9PEZI|nr:hypothetical protein B0H66DRAFT_622909 [Apodospora peruviana]
MGSLPSPGPPPKRKRVLLLTNSEHGQANVYLATSYALLTLPDEDVDVHFASFAPIHKFVVATSQHAERDRPSSRSGGIIFHTISGLDMVSAWERPEVLAEQESIAKVEATAQWWSVLSLTSCAIRRMILLLRVTLPWTGPEFVQIFWSVIEIVRDVQPDIIAVDPAFSPALTALRHINAKFIILSPNTIKDFAMPLQPNAEALWKYPCVGKAYDFPVPVQHIPMNIFLILLTIVCGLFLDAHRRAIQLYVQEKADGAQLTTLNDLSLNPHVFGVKFLVANLPELEFPLKLIPAHIVPCGPMIRPARPVREVDAGLAGWLAQGPTLYINLGTHMRCKEQFAIEMATAIRIVLDHARGQLWRDKRLAGLQVLWKLTKRGEYDVTKVGSAVHKILGRDIDSGRVKIVDWIEAEPTAVLETETVICAVHHGGANSFLETVCVGIPQVVLPVWMDTYDFARRAEILGIGRWGNRLSDGRLCKGGELGSILIDVLLGGRSSLYEKNAKLLAQKCREFGGGRVRAARHILAEIDEACFHGEETCRHSTANGGTDHVVEKDEEKEKLLFRGLNGKSNGHA